VGVCVYCGQPAGLFRRHCKECVGQRAIASKKLPEFFAKYLTSDLPPARFKSLAREIAASHHLTQTEARHLQIKGFQRLIETALADHMLTEQEESRIASLRTELGLTQDELGASHAALVKAAILRDLDQGRVPRRINFEGNCPVNLRHGEIIVWVFNNVAYHTVRSRTHYVGGSMGVSLRVMKGVYYRVGASKGERVQSAYLSHEGNGDLYVTDRAVYFVSPTSTFRIHGAKIVSIKPYSDGIEITRDAATAKPQIFILDDPWFATNLISRLNQIND
jgi:hypothetical protein